MLIAAIDTSFDERTRVHIIGILIGPYNLILSLYKSISNKIHRSYLHFREMSREEKNITFSIIRQYANKIRLIVILVEKRNLTLDKRKSIAKFIEKILIGANVSHVYVCTDLDRRCKGTFILAKSLKIKAPISRGDHFIPIQVADLIINYYRRENKGLNVSVKYHHC